MSSSIGSVFHSADSSLGVAKQDFFNTNAVIAAKHSEVDPMYRTSWEQLLDFGKIGSALFAEAMRKAEDGELPANQLENEPVDGNYVFLFCMTQAQALANSFDDYNPEHGFDVDLAIIVGSMFDFQAIQVYCEVFPRSKESHMVTDFASTISHHSPLRVIDDEMGGGDQIVVPVMGLLQGEGGARGEEASDLAERITNWWSAKGVWPVSGEFLINFFLNRTLSSIALSEGENVLAGSVHREFDGTPSDASFENQRVV